MQNKIYKIDQNQLPNKLQIIEKPPKQLYCIGNKELLYEESFGIVGSRNITSYGIKNCKYFSKEFALRDIPVVSGMARGTDTIAHKTALNYCGKTIAVLGTGLENIFPPENEELFKRIINNGGLVVSEYENHIGPSKERFPERNRIVSALSEGILVIEAAILSGTAITARYAQKQEKLVFAIPGKITDKQSIGTNRLIKNGAILTVDINDILVNYPQFMNKLRKTNTDKKMKKEYRQIYKILKESNNTTDELLRNTKYNIKDLLNLLSNMELEGIIIQEMGVYKINEKY